ncbi:hypothetical protein [Candidatus Cardinium hertigii]|nr:hypothetical protein [Candidatus Cardinium hertigii]
MISITTASLPQSPGTGWIEPDDALKQIRQAHTWKKECLAG